MAVIKTLHFSYFMMMFCVFNYYLNEIPVSRVIYFEDYKLIVVELKLRIWYDY